MEVIQKIVFPFNFLAIYISVNTHVFFKLFSSSALQPVVVLAVRGSHRRTKKCLKPFIIHFQPGVSCEFAPGSRFGVSPLTTEELLTSSESHYPSWMSLWFKVLQYCFRNLGFNLATPAVAKPYSHQMQNPFTSQDNKNDDDDNNSYFAFAKTSFI